MRIKAITLWEPWATLMARPLNRLGHPSKRIETRSWKTKYRGLIAVHSSKRWRNDQRQSCYRHPMAKTLHELGIVDLDQDFHFGCILAIGRLSAIVSSGAAKTRLSQLGEVGQLELSFGNYQPNRYAWAVTEIMPLPHPIYAKGAQGLWWWDCPDKLIKKFAMGT